MSYDYQVDIQIYRAKKADLPATLTQAHWASTLNHFQNRCAYCHGPYESIDHFLPLSRGGGSTYENCVPACASCNTCKDHPKFILLGNKDKAIVALERVLTYLRSVSSNYDMQIIEAYIEYQRDRIPIHHLRQRKKASDDDTVKQEQSHVQ